MPSQNLGDASHARAASLDAVSRARRGQVQVQPIIYINGREIAALGPYYNRYRNEAEDSANPYRYPAGNSNQDFYASRNDAEVFAANAVERYLQGYRRQQEQNGIPVPPASKIYIDMNSNEGACNPCKSRMNYLQQRLAQIFPEAKDSRGNPKVRVVNNYDASDNQPAARLGRHGNTVYGSPDATLRTNAATVIQANGEVTSQSLYWHERFRGDNPHIVRPEDLSYQWRRPRIGTEVGDDDSPHFTTTTGSSGNGTSGSNGTGSGSSSSGSKEGSPSRTTDQPLATGAGQEITVMRNVSLAAQSTATAGSSSSQTAPATQRSTSSRTAASGNSTAGNATTRSRK